MRPIHTLSPLKPLLLKDKTELKDQAVQCEQAQETYMTEVTQYEQPRQLRPERDQPVGMMHGPVERPWDYESHISSVRQSTERE